ncbi:Vacuolar protein sorting-associated protein 17 [Spiromyces aspiralis]|uniref:Vacuolar protein sorting-associated protein 17 n=1 Tax=Spiromyces aspiralis TaxID=68401 RepID=A0ACC1HFK8_9FUNG|nr:Vacuolar protein sorting-associated protein 17 [Spiromyces aspiralis]
MSSAFIAPALSFGSSSNPNNDNNNNDNDGTDNDQRTQTDSDSGNHAVKSPQPSSLQDSLVFTLSPTVNRLGNNPPVFHFDVSTNLPNYKQRRYKNRERSQLEFERLASHLRATYPECLLPSLPALDATSKYTPTYQNNDVIIEYLQQWLNWIASHPVMKRDYELAVFVETPFAFNPSLTSGSTVARPPPLHASSAGSLTPSSSAGSGSRGLFSWRKHASKSPASVKPEEDAYLEDKHGNYKRFEENSWGVVQWSGRATRRRVALAEDVKRCGQRVATVGRAEMDTRLARYSNRVGSRMVYVFNTHLVASNQIKEIVGGRHAVFKDYDAAAKKLEHKKQAVAVLRASSTINPERVSHILQEMDAAKLDEAVKRERVERLTQVLSDDLERYERMREQDIARQLQFIGRAQVMAEKAVLNECRAALKAIKQ